MSKHNSNWLAGVARQKITPPAGVELAGLGYFLKRTWKSIADDLNATALVISEATGASVAFVALDLLYMDGQYVRAIREKVATKIDLHPEAICINCSHSHNAPTVAFFDGAGEIDPAYAQHVVEVVAETIVDAYQKRVPVSLHVGSQRLQGLTYNRTRNNGPVDDRVSVLQAKTIDGKPLAVAVNFHTHPTVFWQVDPRAVSRDAPGHIVDLIEQELPGVTAMYLQGSCGDVNFNLEYWTPERYREAGKAVYEAAKCAWIGAREVSQSGISFAAREGDLPVRRWTREEVLEMYDEGKRRLSTGDTDGWLTGIASKMVGLPARLPERYGGSVQKAVEAVSLFAVRWGEATLPILDRMPQTRKAEFQAIRIGDVYFVANQAELFSSLALAIRHEWSKEDLFILGYSNGALSYLPDAEEVDRGSYASLHVPKAIRELPFTREAGIAVVRECLAALRAAQSNSL